MNKTVTTLNLVNALTVHTMTVDEMSTMFSVSKRTVKRYLNSIRNSDIRLRSKRNGATKPASYWIQGILVRAL